MNKVLMIFGLLLAFNLGTVETAEAQVVVSVRPSRPRVVAKRPARARKGYVWVAGHWRAQGRKYVWVKGQYVRARKGYRYVPGKWVTARGGHKWKPGVWVRL